MVAVVLNAVIGLLLAWSWVRDPGKTKQALRRALFRGLGLGPTMVLILLLIGVLFALVPPETMEHLLGGETTGLRVAAASVFGALTFIPSLVALPLAGSLVDAGANYMPVAAFITTLTMVGAVTLPLEIKEVGLRITLWRNALAFLFAVLISLAVGVVV